MQEYNEKSRLWFRSVKILSIILAFMLLGLVVTTLFCYFTDYAITIPAYLGSGVFVVALADWICYRQYQKWYQRVSTSL